MAYSTAADIIKSSMRIVGVIAKSETPTADEMNDGLQALNLMLEMWSARKLMIPATTQVSWTLTPGTASYTIGTGGVINVPKPLKVYSAFARDSSLTDAALDIITQEEYDGYSDKAIVQSRPIALCYNRGLAQQASQLGTILIYYTPDSSTTYTVTMEVQNFLTDFVFLTDSVTFEAQYGEAMKYELAKRLWREYRGAQIPIPQDILELAARAMCVIEKINHVIPRVGIEVPPRRSVFNIYTGDYN